MIVVAVVYGQLPQIFPIKLARASTAYPGIHFQRPAAVTLFSFRARLRDNAVKLVGGIV